MNFFRALLKLPYRAYLKLRTRWLLARSRVRYATLPSFQTPILPYISNSGEITLGTGFRIDSFFAASRLITEGTGRIEIGDCVYINSGVHIIAAEGVTIGSNTKIAPEVIISDTSHHKTTPDRPAAPQKVTIGRNVWLCTRAIILPGATIGDHSVVAAGAVVRGTIPPRSIVSGNPAVVIKSFECEDGWIRQ
jgi:acetyltransferase-like isoleucine patch superfamily enzyme